MQRNCKKKQINMIRYNHLIDHSDKRIKKKLIDGQEYRAVCGKLKQVLNIRNPKNNECLLSSVTYSSAIKVINLCVVIKQSREYNKHDIF